MTIPAITRENLPSVVLALKSEVDRLINELGLHIDDNGRLASIRGIDSDLLTGRDFKLVTGTAGAANALLKWNGDGDAVAATAVEDSSGQVGIGTTSPSALLDISGTSNPGLEIEETGSGRIWEIRQGAVNDLLLTENGTGAAELTIHDSNATNPGEVHHRFFVGLGVNAADPTTIANRAHVYAKDVSASAEVFVQDEAGNATQISPHDPETGEWVFYSENVRTGRKVRINMERLVRAVEAHLGESFSEIEE